ncbi:hypothetical protein B0H13DRAFT_1927094 [Mycena leptocephala]|nr:hypothetical protein B0H13DRAFT_1927094 [Mycena leptocephala]
MALNSGRQNGRSDERRKKQKLQDLKRHALGWLQPPTTASGSSHKAMSGASSALHGAIIAHGWMDKIDYVRACGYWSGVSEVQAPSGDGRAEDIQIQIHRQPDGVEHQRDQRVDRTLRMARANAERGSLNQKQRESSPAELGRKLRMESTQIRSRDNDPKERTFSLVYVGATLRTTTPPTRREISQWQQDVPGADVVGSAITLPKVEPDADLDADEADTDNEEETG